MRKEGKSVKRWWLNSWAKQLVQELYPVDEDFKFSDGWFNRFCKMKAISLRHKTQAKNHIAIFQNQLKIFMQKLCGNESGELIH